MPPDVAGGELTLRRSISLWQMTLYSAGGMLGAGIYGLIGQVARHVARRVLLLIHELPTTTRRTLGLEGSDTAWRVADGGPN